MLDQTERLKKLETLSTELNSEMPTDIYLKGDGKLWVTVHGNEGVRPRPITQEEALKLIYKAKRFGDAMISV